jgi:hypothetical protein
VFKFSGQPEVFKKIRKHMKKKLFFAEFSQDFTLKDKLGQGKYSKVINHHPSQILGLLMSEDR